ncbi:tetratricopeptide repeat protein [Leptotrichia sp. OH3620_COT-345]|uniref:tetratricopeptide repeat protein n=1 Tax=Leptotrichia sp. OH3620_COT-345 TaxID=2491048 RepID=UPI000F653981|nr:tetratricopeptide repeat protein [Leptotrichia sp. OH3620_COT-345]RRD38962.1 tetratricopeptide repeat protein [Leptotrichia sp. OH3620_COT-345]
MKKIVCMILFPLIILSCGKTDRGYDALENGLLGILRKKDEKYITANLEQAAKDGNMDVFSLAYVYWGISGEEFFNKYLNKSKGNAEYYKALIMKEKNDPEEKVVGMLENAASQGNYKAYYVLGNIFQDKLEFSKAQEYLKKGKEHGEIYSLYSYEYNKSLTGVYKRIEELNKKLKNNVITPDEKKELGTLVLEKFSNYDTAYNILREFLSEGYSPALYSKAKKLETENKDEEAVRIYNDLFSENKYYLASFELAYKLVNMSKNYNLALRVLEDTSSEDSLITGYKGFVYENLKKYDKAEENYLKSVQKNDIDIMSYLGRLYEEKNKQKEAKDIYNRAYSSGSISAGYRLANLLEESDKGKNDKNKKNKQYRTQRSNKAAKKILERLSENGDDYSTVDLSLYYPETDKNVKVLNLRAAIKLNETAFHNLGVYYYNKKNKKKAKLYFQIAKEYGYRLEPEYEAFISI